MYSKHMTNKLQSAPYTNGGEREERVIRVFALKDEAADKIKRGEGRKEVEGRSSANYEEKKPSKISGTTEGCQGMARIGHFGSILAQCNIRQWVLSNFVLILTKLF